MLTSTIAVESIADHLDLIDTIARWHWDEWGHLDPGGTLQSWADGLWERTKRDAVPTTYVAMHSGYLLGSVTLVEHDMDINREFSPWLAGVYVAPEHRGSGVGSKLVLYAVAASAKMGVERLYLYTSSARGFYEKLGWYSVTWDEYQGQQVCIMAIDLADKQCRTSV